MRILVLIIALLGIVNHCTAIRCYIGSADTITTEVSKTNQYCSKAWVQCGDSNVVCTSAEITAQVYKWAYFHTTSLSLQYQNQTVCTTALCNEPESLSDGFWCYIGYGYSKEKYEYLRVTYSSGNSCGIYGTACKSGLIGCTQEMINAKHLMYYALAYTASNCIDYSYQTSYVNFTCCKGDFCAKPAPFRCNSAISTPTGSPFTVVEAPFDETTYSCYSYNVPCNGTDCELGLLRSHYGYTAASTCMNQPSPIKDILCCDYKECNKPLNCYVGMSPKTAVLTSRLFDGYPTECSTEYRNCSIVQEGCTPEEIGLGRSKAYYTYVQSSKCTSRCCSKDGCNAPASLLCYNTSNISNQTQPDSTKSIEKYDSTDNCARFSYDCSNPLSKEFCTASEVSKASIKTIYRSATDAQCTTAQKDYMNVLDPYCCKTALCNSYAAVKSSLSCYSGDLASGQAILKTSYIKLPSAGSYKCYSRTYTCSAVSSSCSQADVNNKVVRNEYGVTLSCTLLSCCSTNLCNRLDTNPLADSIVATSSGSSSGGGGGGSSPKSSARVNASDANNLSIVSLVLLCLVSLFVYKF